MPSYSKMKKAELIERIEQLEADTTQPTQANGQVFDLVKRRWNAHGPLYNCRFTEGITSIPSLAAMADEIQIDARARSEVRKDRHGRIWVDVYPKSEERQLFEQNEEVAS